jgi:arabinose-5-phosphate isomerase
MDIKLVCFDFDGVFTNGNIYFLNNIMNKYYNIKDGMGLKILKDNNIKYGLITGFKNKDYLINDNNIYSLLEHLKFDYFKLGVDNKLIVLDEWIKELNINYTNVAYIGDDINDIEILEKVIYSACPNDAVKECKNVVKYVCNNKGGDGCVREFIDKILDLKKNKYEKNKYEKNKYDKIIQEIKLESNYQLNNINLYDIIHIADIIQNKIIYCTGVGKSENIAIHCSNLLKSIGFKSYYLNCLNSIHGDIGTLNSNDVILIFSKSGNTNELINIIPSLRLHKSYLISISCNENGLLNKICDKAITLPLQNELIGNINTIPTNSYMSMLYFINILIMIIIDKYNINYDSYKLNHPGGNIGLNLMSINDVIIAEFPKIILNDHIHLSDILLEMTKYSFGCCFFVNKNDELIGLLTDGDIRRLLCENKNMDIITKANINTLFYYETDKNKMLCDIKNFKNYKFIPVLEHNKLIGIIKC